MQNKNILLLVDKCCAHKGLELKHVQIMHLPLNTINYMQPLDQRDDLCLKRAYWKHLA